MQIFCSVFVRWKRCVFKNALMWFRPDYDIFTEDSSENENENTYTEASKWLFIIRPRNRSSTMPKPIWTGSSCHPVELIKLLKTIYKKWQLAVFVKAKKQRALNTDWEKNCYCHHESDLKIIHHEKLLRLNLSDSHSSTFSDLINQWLLWKLCYALREKIETKRTKKRLSLWHGWSFCWTFKHRRQPKTPKRE